MGNLKRTRVVRFPVRLAFLGTVFLALLLGQNPRWVDSIFELFWYQGAHDLVTRRVSLADRITVDASACENARYERRSDQYRETLNVLGTEHDRCVVAVRHTDRERRYQTWVCRLMAQPLPLHLQVSRSGVEFELSPEDERPDFFHWGSCALVEAGTVSWLRT